MKRLLAREIDVDGYNLFDYPNESGSPDRNLLMAILERAILDYVGNDAKELQDAEHWIFADLEEPGFEEFSFPWLCQQLDLDMDKIASQIKAMPKRGNRRVAPWYFNENSQVLTDNSLADNSLADTSAENKVVLSVAKKVEHVKNAALLPSQSTTKYWNDGEYLRKAS
jgi:hypothetical protein